LNNSLCHEDHSAKYKVRPDGGSGGADPCFTRGSCLYSRDGFFEGLAMCLAIPGKIESIDGVDPLMRMGRVSFGGIVKEVSLAYVPEAKVGDYVVVHVGFAISQVDEQEAQQVFSYLKQMDELTELNDANQTIHNDRR
jgi:hydrogenase expression/formation protein HypC